MANGMFRGVRRYSQDKVISVPVGATALMRGDLCKVSSNKLVPVADNDKQLGVFVALQDADASAAACLAVPFKDCVVELEYTGSPAILGNYGVSGPRTVDATDTTNLLVTVVAPPNTSRTTVLVTEYHLSA